ncbi:MAG: metal ABC transporter substrate-binding protein [Nitrospira sp.]|nr:metal ABC transporter substrate-binding protein [Nitrospira sp.]
MKKFFVILVAIFLIKGLAWAAPLHVVTTTEDLAAIAREVGGPLVEVESLARGTQDPHFLEARPSMILKTSRADLFIEMGAELEMGWAPPLLIGARNPAIQPGASGFLDVSNNIELLEVPTGRVDRSQGDVHPLGNPHYQLDPENGKTIAQSIAKKLAALLPNQSETINQNLKEFNRKLDEAITRWKAQMKPYEGTKVVTYHKSWNYLAKRFGLNVIDYVEDKPGIPPSPTHINHLIAAMKQEKPKLIIMEPWFSRSIPDLLSRETGTKVLVLPPTVGGAEGVKTYFDLFNYLISQLTKALSERS